MNKRIAIALAGSALALAACSNAAAPAPEATAPAAADRAPILTLVLDIPDEAVDGGTFYASRGFELPAGTYDFVVASGEIGAVCLAPSPEWEDISGGRSKWPDLNAQKAWEAGGFTEPGQPCNLVGDDAPGGTTVTLGAQPRVPYEVRGKRAGDVIEVFKAEVNA